MIQIGELPCAISSTITRTRFISRYVLSAALMASVASSSHSANKSQQIMDVAYVNQNLQHLVGKRILLTGFLLRGSTPKIWRLFQGKLAYATGLNRYACAFEGQPKPVWVKVALDYRVHLDIPSKLARESYGTVGRRVLISGKLLNEHEFDNVDVEIPLSPEAELKGSIGPLVNVKIQKTYPEICLGVQP